MAQLFLQLLLKFILDSGQSKDVNLRIIESCPELNFVFEIDLPVEKKFQLRQLG
jgi:hypothetical protein